jgi:GTP-binding protein HflX
VSLSDTVGFIRDLPHKLVEAFEATLQEAAEADLLLHLVDAASPLLDEQVAEVERVLEDIGAAQIPQILVYNKCDLLEDSRQSRERTDWLEVHPNVRRQRVFVSAVTGEGLPDLRQAIAQHAAARLNGGEHAPSTEDGLATAATAATALPGADPATSHPFPHA